MACDDLMKYLSTKEILQNTFDTIKLLGESGVVPNDKQVHKIRVSNKRLRARLQLLNRLAGQLYETTDIVDQLKKLNQYLSGQRDYDVVVKLLDCIIEDEKNSKLLPLFIKIKESIVRSSRVESLNYKDIQKVTIEIWNCYMCLPDTNIKLDDISSHIQKSFRKICKSGSHAMKIQGCDGLHEWRKQVKNLVYQYEILHKGKYDLSLPMKELEKLGDKLGQVHDLCFLEQIINEQYDDISQHFEALDNEFIHHYLFSKRKDITEKCSNLHKKICSGKQIY